jgi:hypothetical protein
MHLTISRSFFGLVLLTNLSAFAQTVYDPPHLDSFKYKSEKITDVAAGIQSLKLAKELKQKAHMNIQDKELSKMSMGGVATGGGDLCEDRIKIIRDDLKSWIQKGGAAHLTLPSQLSPVTYSQKMLTQISTASIKCVGTGDPEFPVLINGTPKVCRFDLVSSEGKITCDFNKFLSMSESDQYVLTHHEYAGLAEIEVPIGDDSNYEFSNQLSGYLVDQQVKRLAVKNSSVAGFTAIPNEKLSAYKEAAIIAGKQGNLTNCSAVVSGTHAYDALETYIAKSDSGKIKADSKQPILIFGITALQDDLNRKAVITVISTANYKTIVSVKLDELALENVNEGTLENPKIVKSYVVKFSQICKMK